MGLQHPDPQFKSGWRLSQASELNSGAFIFEGDILNLSELSDNFLIKLRNDNTFSTDDYEKIKSVLINNVAEWKLKGSVPVKNVVDIVFLIDQLAGGSRFFDDETALKVEDACLEIEDIINNLI